jgi:hypothetical protein
MLPLISDIELAVQKSRTLETRLEREHGAKGEGLGQEIESVEKKLPPETVKQLKKVNKMRNEIVHEEGRNRLSSRREFVQLCQEIERSLNELEKPRKAQARKRRFLATTFIITASAIIYFLSQNLP